jgi:hypothetical protein
LNPRSVLWGPRARGVRGGPLSGLGHPLEIGWRWRTVSSRRPPRFQCGALPSELLQLVIDGPDPGGRTRSWRFCRPPPSHLARSGLWHQGNDSNARLMVQSHVSYRLNDPDVYLIGAPDGNRTRQALFDRQVSPPEDGEGASCNLIWLAMPIRFSRCYRLPDKRKRAWRLPDPWLVDLSTLRLKPQGANPKGLAGAMGMAA